MITYDELIMEKNEIEKMQEEYFSRVLDIIKKYEVEMKIYKDKIQKDKEYIELLETKVKELESYREKGINSINQINEKSIINKQTSFSSIEELKEAFLNDSNTITFIIAKIMPKLSTLGYRINEGDILFLICVAYFNNKLKEITRKSKVVENYLKDNYVLEKLFIILDAEKKCKVNSKKDICFMNYMKENINIFDILDESIRLKIIEEFEINAYIVFEKVDSLKNCYGNSYRIGWLKDKSSNKWILLDEPYSDAKNTVYLETGLIEKLGYNEFTKEKEVSKPREAKSYVPNIMTVVKDIDEIEKDFYNKTVTRIKDILKAKLQKSEAVKLLNLVEDLEFSGEKILRADAYSILIIASFYGVLDNVLKSCKYLEDIYKENSNESKLIKLLYEEINYDFKKGIDEPVKKFYSKNRDKFNKINIKMLKVLDEKIEEMFKDAIENVIKVDMLDKCILDNTILTNKEVYVKLLNKNNQKKYVKAFIAVCKKCNHAYVVEKRINLINNLIEGYNIIYEDENNNKYSIDSFFDSNNKIQVNEEFYEGKVLSDESDLKKLGYSVSLSRSERMDILKRHAIPKLGKRKVESHIRWLIKINENRSDRKNAIFEWKYDLDALLRI